MAVRALPTCRKPVGLGANRTRTIFVLTWQFSILPWGTLVVERRRQGAACRGRPAERASVEALDGLDFLQEVRRQEAAPLELVLDLPRNGEVQERLPEP